MYSRVFHVLVYERFARLFVDLRFSLGKGLEKVNLRVFGLRKVRKMAKNAETEKNTIQTVFDPSFFHITLGGPSATGPKKNPEKNTLTREIWQREKRPPASENRIPFLGQISPRYT